MYNLLSSGYKAVTVVTDAYRSASPATKKPLESINIEGFTSAMRIAMFPYAPGAKLSLEEFAINFDFPYKISGGLDAKSVTRFWNGEGRHHFIIVKRIARIMLDLFPPIPVEENKEIEPITKIYYHVINGLEFIRQTFFGDQPLVTKVPSLDSFDFDVDSKKHPLITELMAGDAVQKTINLFKYCCLNKIEPKKELTPLQVDVKNIYNKMMIFQMANGLDLLVQRQGKISLTANWISQNEFMSLDYLIRGRIAHYQEFVIKSGTLIRGKKEINLIHPASLDDSKDPLNKPLSTSKSDESTKENGKSIITQVEVNPITPSFNNEKLKKIYPSIQPITEYNPHDSLETVVNENKSLFIEKTKSNSDHYKVETNVTEEAIDNLIVEMLSNNNENNEY